MIITFKIDKAPDLWVNWEIGTKTLKLYRAGFPGTELWFARHIRTELTPELAQAKAEKWLNTIVAIQENSYALEEAE